MSDNSIVSLMDKVTKITQTVIAIGVAVGAFILFYVLLIRGIEGHDKPFKKHRVGKK